MALLRSVDVALDPQELDDPICTNAKREDRRRPDGTHWIDMKTLYATAYGGIDVLQFGDLPKPVPQAGQVLVAVKASSVNPLDWKIRQGDLKLVTGRSFPMILGTDFAGIIEEMNADGSGFQVGDPVYGLLPVWNRKHGAHAEFLTASGKLLRRMPDGLSYEQMASLPAAGLTALDGLHPYDNLEGKRVVVNGATGGVGHFALQMAVNKGATVTAVCKGSKADWAWALGADTVIDYQEVDFTRSGLGYDIIFDAYGRLGFQRASPALTKCGVYITTQASPVERLKTVWRRTRGRKQSHGASAISRPDRYTELERLVQSGEVTPLIEHTFPLSQAAHAFEILESGMAVGKVIIQI